MATLPRSGCCILRAMPREAEPHLEGVDALVRAVRDPGKDLRAKYKGKPIELANSLQLQLPQKPRQVMKELGLWDGEVTPGLRDLVEDVTLGLVRSAAVVGPRGGGKSLGVAFIEFYLWMIEMYDALNLGGSELQADQVYQYLLSFIESDDYWKSLLLGEPMQSKSETLERAWIRVLTASQKSVRSPHAGGKKRDGREAGGLLVIDEEAEAAAEIVEAALPTVNTARPSVVVRSSTFHNNEGTFADLIDNHDEMGFKLYEWDIFDVCERCDCIDVCQSPEPCFREDHVEKYTDPETGEETENMLHPAYCGGKAMYANGWIPIEEVHALWRRIKRNHSRWEVEAMGSRPSSSGFVIKDPKRFKASQVDVPALELYEPGYPVTVCVDWGTAAAGLMVWQEQMADMHVLLHADLLEEAGQSQIFAGILGYWSKYMGDAVEVAADIGGGGNYLNPKLREEEMIPVRDVNFQEEKESAVAAWNTYNEAGKIIIPKEHEEFIRQVKKWKRKNGRIVKGEDHLCDSAVCYFAKFAERLGIRKTRVVGRSFSTASPTVDAGSKGPPANGATLERVHAVRVPMARALRSKR